AAPGWLHGFQTARRSVAFSGPPGVSRQYDRCAAGGMMHSAFRAAPLPDLEALLSEDLGSVRDRERSSLDRILAQVDGRLVLFGVGSLGLSSLQCLLRDGIRPVAVCDNNRALWGATVEGVPILSPAEAAAHYGSSAAFFVTIWVTNHRYAETCDQLVAAGCRHVYSAAPLRWKYSQDLLPYFLQD